MGYIVLVAALCAIGYITLPALRIAFQGWFFPKLYKGTQPTLPSGVRAVEPPAAVIEVPEGILAYAASWNSAWAAEDAVERAKRLYVELNNWELVYQELRRQDGEKV